MNNLKKVGLTALAGALVSVSANAADLSVTGGASIGFFGEEKKLTGNGWSMNDGITFGASNELDNGWNVSLSFIMDSSDGAAGAILDTRILTIDMGDSGTLKFSGTGGSSVLNAVDDTTPTAYEESWDLVTGADTIPGGTGGDNMFHYSNSSLMDDFVVSASYTPSNKATVIESSMDYGVVYTPSGVDGLTIGAAAGENNAAAASLDITSMYVKYAMEGGFTLGYTASESDSETASADLDFTAMGISYAVTPETSVSINSSTVEYENSSLSDQEATGLSVSHVMGSMTLKAAHNSVDNIAGAATDDRSAYDLSLAFAF
jgi:outer membrane protein OmpU